MDEKRRTLVKALFTGTAYLLLDSSPLFAQANESNGPYSPRYRPGEGFPQSVASGDPTPTGAILWTRVDPAVTQGIGKDEFDPRLFARDAPATETFAALRRGSFVRFEVATDPDFGRVVRRGYAPIYRDFDNVVKVDLDGQLQPRSLYYYRFTTLDGHTSRVGRFKTVAAETAALTTLRLGCVTCGDYTSGYYHAYRLLAQEEVDLVVHLGDYIYEAVGAEGYQNPLPDRQIQLPSGNVKATTLEDYRTLYRIYRSDPDLQALHERHAMAVIWDDHEFANDAYAATAPDDNPTPDPLRRNAASQAWFEYMPARVQFDAAADFQSAIRLYRSIKFGNLAELLLTDERLYRSAHPCGESTVGQRYLSPGCPRMFDAEQTMFGAEQRAWFLRRLNDSTSVWKVWANEVQFTQFKILGLYLDLDAWDGYAAERTRLLEAIQRSRVQNFVALTGDLHSFEANIIPSRFSLIWPGRPLGVELMTGSVTSGNLRELIEQRFSGSFCRNAPLPTDTADGLLGILHADSADDFFNKLALLVSLENPWIKFFNSSEHGYSVLELSPRMLTWTAYAVGDTRSRAGANKRTLYRCEVPEGTPSLRTLEQNDRKDNF